MAELYSEAKEVEKGLGGLDGFYEPKKCQAFVFLMLRATALSDSIKRPEPMNQIKSLGAFAFFFKPPLKLGLITVTKSL
jgi:hypothetical protein